MIIVLAAMTMTLGNLVALTQDNVKRMLAYSLDRPHRLHAGGAGGVRRGPDQGLEGLLFYGVAYTFMNLGAFAVVAALQRRLGVTEPVDVRGPRPSRADARRCS